MKKIISVDYMNAKSIARAEKKKTRLENLGYSPAGTRQVGLQKFKISMMKSKMRSVS